MRTALVGICLSAIVAASPAEEVRLEYAPAPAGNPLKGLVPYMGDHGDKFAHSMEFFYLPLSDVIAGGNDYDWEPIERRIREINGRGHQAIFRLYLEYPGKPTGVPAYLRDEALDEKGRPDYSNARLQRCLREFIGFFGVKYGNDSRIGYLTAGLLGKWGEWHTSPEEERWASRKFQAQVLDEFEKAFRGTPVLLRYPAGADDKRLATNANRPFGYHDDSFGWATLDTGRDEDSWFYMAALERSGALDKWKTHPIGGEIRPEAWGQCFDPEPENPRVQDFDECVKETHVTWLMDSGMFSDDFRTPQRVARAKEAVREMGYEIHLRWAKWEVEGSGTKIEIEIENRGVAPFYAGWPSRWAAINPKGEIVGEIEMATGPGGLLPGKRKRIEGGVLLEARPRGRYKLLISVPNPITDGVPLRFANKTQDADAPGWLTLGEIEW